ncbi:MAG: S-layer homology domain-containing protein [Clostridiales bacterium]|nr:S-layer homology domain-containing protein [Clostridiales bacterium]
MTWAVGAELITGKDGGKLDPTGTATRAEVATILMRFCENVTK